MRFLPHDQDTGGFFVCCIEKTGKLPWESDRKKSVQIANKHEDEPPSKKIKVVEKYRHGAYNEDPFYFYDGVESEAIKEAMELGVGEMRFFATSDPKIFNPAENLPHQLFPYSTRWTPPRFHAT